MRFVYSDSCKNGMTKQKLLKVQLRSSNITFFRVSRVPERCTGIFKVSNAWTNMRNKMMEEKAWDRVQNSKKRFEKNEYACSSDGSFRTSDPTALPYWKLACPAWTNQSLSNLLQFLNWQAEIPDTPLGLTGTVSGVSKIFKYWLLVLKLCLPQQPFTSRAPHLLHSCATLSNRWTQSLPRSRTPSSQLYGCGCSLWAWRPDSFWFERWSLSQQPTHLSPILL